MNITATRHPTKSHSLQRIIELGLPVGTVLDVGVMTGTGELKAAFRDKPHLLFEPITEWNDAIRRNYAGLDIELINVAVSDRIGTATLRLQSIKEGMPITHARIDESAAGRQSRQVPTSTLDALVEGRKLAAPYLLKIDVDGAELSILEGAKRTLPKCSVVIVEAHTANFTARARPLENAGFELFDLVDLAYYDRRLAQFDMVFVNAALVEQLRLGMYEGGFDYAKWVNYSPV